MNLIINHRLGMSNVDYFNEFSLDLRFDSVASTFGFKFYFDPKNREHAELACVSHFHEAIVQHNGETLVTGYILSQEFNSGPQKQMAQFGGYSKPGVLADCTIPPDLYPLQTNGLSIRQICERIATRFKLKTKVTDSAQKDAALGYTVKQKADADVKQTSATESQNIMSYLTEICTQRNIVLSHNENGDLLLTEAETTKKPLFHVEDGLIGTTIKLNFNGQGMHSHITVLKQASADGGNAGEYTIRNPYVPIVYRPNVVTANSGDDVTIQEAAINELAKELKNITLTVTTDRWEVDGKLIKPNNIITVYSPENFIYKKTEWFIESINFVGDNKKTTATLNCVLPEVYNGKMPKNIFVEVHENLPRFNYSKGL
jgi:prophage tail gpP-like protein